jgi:hypothetical protein
MTIRRSNPALAQQPPQYRDDGWPLCPCCGEDELWSAQRPVRPTDELQCYRCCWRGTVPVSAKMRARFKLEDTR